MLRGLQLIPRRCSDRNWTLASYHPPHSGTWYWAVYVYKLHVSETPRPVSRAIGRTNQWHDSYWLPFRYRLGVSRQDYHRQSRARA